MAVAPGERLRQLIAYALCGFFTTVVNVVSFRLCRALFGWPLLPSNVAAWCLSVSFAFVTNRRFVFVAALGVRDARSPSREPPSKAVVRLREFVLFVLSRLFSLALDMAFVWLTVAVLAFDELAMKILSNIIVIVVNYLTGLLLVFRSGDAPWKKKNRVI